MGTGQQYVSYISEPDFCRAINFLIEREDLNGIFNLASPNPLTNRRMMKHIRDHYRVPFGLPAAKWMLELGAKLLRTETELILKSRNVIPTRLLNEGFTFKHPEFKLML